MSDGGRSPEERERARLEREAKRAKREGRPPPLAPPPTEVPPPPIDKAPAEPAPPPRPLVRPEPAPPPRPVARAEPAARPKPTVPWPKPAARPEPSAPPAEAPRREASPPPEGSPPEHAPSALEVEPQAPPDQAPPAPKVESQTEVEPPTEVEPRRPQPPAPYRPDPRALDGAAPRDPPRQRTRSFPKLPRERAPVDVGGRPPGPGAAARSATARDILERRRARVASSGPSRRRRRRLVPLVLAGLVGLALVWFLVSLFQPFAGDGEGSVAVTIPSGAGVGEIAELLADRDVISSAFFFRARATVSGRANDFKAGKFALREGMSYAAAMDALAQSPDAQTLSVTIPEGRARREVKPLVDDVLEGGYLALTRRSRLLDPGDYGAEGARDLEGFLFPATYELKRGRGAKELVRQQLQTFKREFAKVDMGFAKKKNLTRYDVLVIASMVEREAQVAKERPLVASVIYNRLREGIYLGIDATIRFATNNWTEPLTESELAVDSPYNTRKVQGLPPGPIGSPGLASLKAAARPANTGFLFYVVKPNTCGEHEFSKTDAEFQRDVDRYNSEREARGGQSPTDC